MCGVGELAHQGEHALHGVDDTRHLISDGPHVGHAVVHVLHVLGQRGALHADLKWNGGVRDWGAQRPGDGLNASDTVSLEDALGHPVQDEHVGGIAHVVVGLDQQQVGVQPCR